MDRGLSPQRAINLPPAFLTPSIQEYHIRNCLTFKKHTNLWIAFYIKTKDDCCIMFLIYNLLTRVRPSPAFYDKPDSLRFSIFEF
ncbi:hypothetical protein [Leptospira interrogans]|uniref:hypothetical protein n=1 Tax=Leptospira interrogans TaxID=173 RepID=UPI0009E3C944|nr:hypothetical protein [Leptospira interrogans]